MKEIVKNLKFGSVLYDIRTARELSIRGFSRICGFSPAYLSDLEKSNRKPTMQVINSINQKFILTEEENKIMMAAFNHDRLEIPIDIAYYLIDNNLIDSLSIIKEADKSGEKIKKIAKDLSNKITI